MSSAAVRIDSTQTEVNTESKILLPLQKVENTQQAAEAAQNVEKKMSVEKGQLSLLFDGEVPVTNLREKFLYNTFEIIAEKGAEALSASELIKKTQSSKGALFHHFETIDHLCIESLMFFKRYLQSQPYQVTFENLDQFLKFLVADSVKKQATAAYTHLTHFFRDRAIRDVRYRNALSEIFEVNLNRTVNRVMQHLAPGVSREKVTSKVVFMAMTIERVCYYRVLYENPKACQEELDQFMSFMNQEFKNMA